MRTWKVANNVVIADGSETAITAEADEGTYVFGVPTPELAAFIVDACNAAEHLSHIQGHQEEYRGTPYDLHPWGPAMKIGGRPDEVAKS